MPTPSGAGRPGQSRGSRRDRPALVRRRRRTHPRRDRRTRPRPGDRRRPTPSQPPGHAALVGPCPRSRRRREAFAWGDRSWRTSSPWPNGTADTRRRARPRVPPCCAPAHPYLQRSGRGGRAGGPRRAALAGGAAARRRGRRGVRAGRPRGTALLTGREGEALALNDQALAIWRRLGVLLDPALPQQPGDAARKPSAVRRVRRGPAAKPRSTRGSWATRTGGRHLQPPRQPVRAHRSARRDRTAPRSLAIGGDRQGDRPALRALQHRVRPPHARRTGRRAYRTSRRACASWAATATGTASHRPGSAWCGPCAAAAPGTGRARVRTAAPRGRPAPTATPAASPATSRACCCGSGDEPKRRTSSGRRRSTRWTGRTRGRGGGTAGTGGRVGRVPAGELITSRPRSTPPPPS